MKIEFSDQYNLEKAKLQGMKEQEKMVAPAAQAGLESQVANIVNHAIESSLETLPLQKEISDRVWSLQNNDALFSIFPYESGLGNFTLYDVILELSHTQDRVQKHVREDRKLEVEMLRQKTKQRNRYHLDPPGVLVVEQVLEKFNAPAAETAGSVVPMGGPVKALTPLPIDRVFSSARRSIPHH